MEITINYLIDKFDEYNRLYFNNELYHPTFKINKSSKVLGSMQTVKFCGSKFFTLTISKYYDRSEREYDETLIHEMIHQYIGQKNMTDSSSHGYIFKREMNRINKYGWNITIKTDTSKWELKNKNKTYTIIVYHPKNDKNKQFVFRTSEKNVDMFQKHLLKYDYIYKTYRTNDRQFDAYPICQRKIRGNYIHLKPTLELYKI